MKVKQHKVRGEDQWCVDGKVNGKRKRMFFATKSDAKQWLKAEASDTSQQHWWLGLTYGERSDLISAFNRAKEDGFSLLSAVETPAVQGRGKTYLKKMTLAEAVGHLKEDTRFKRREAQPKPSGFLGDKVWACLAEQSQATLASTLRNFRDYIGCNRQCASITSEQIREWVEVGGVKHKEWEKVTKRCYLKTAQNFFNWLIKKDVVTENPVLKLEVIKCDPKEPEILTIKQCRDFMEITREHHAEMLPFAALNLFCGIRPSEVRRLNQSNISFDCKEVTLLGKQTKTRRKRFVDMSENCIAWMMIGSTLPIVDVQHKWEKLLATAKKEMNINRRWPHDCLRHSYCSYHLAFHENAAKTALQAGHTEDVLFDHYRKPIKKSEAAKFWNIFPEKTEELAA